MLFRRSSLNCPKFTKTCSFLLTLYACPGNYDDILPIIIQIYRYYPQENSCFPAFISSQTSYDMTIKPTNRIKGVLSSEHSPNDTISSTKKKSKQPSQEELNLKKQDILLVEAFAVHNARTRIIPDMPYLQTDGQEQY